MAPFPFTNPITEATGYFGGVAMHMSVDETSEMPRAKFLVKSVLDAQYRMQYPNRG